MPTLLLRRAEKHPDKNARVDLRKRAAQLQRDTLDDVVAARESLALVLEDGDDHEALSLLADDAIEGGELTEAVDYLARLVRTTSDPKEQARVVLRQARLLADGVKDVDAAIEDYQRILNELDPNSVEALSAIAEHRRAARALRRGGIVARAAARADDRRRQESGDRRAPRRPLRNSPRRTGWPRSAR